MKKNVSYILGSIFIAVTLCIFFLVNFEKTVVSYVALSFLLLSEIMLFVGIALTGKVDVTNKVFLRSGTIGVLTFYVIAATMLAVMSGGFVDAAKTFVLFEIIAFAVAAVILVIVLFCTLRISSSDEKLISDRKLMQICESQLYDMMSDARNKEFKTLLNKLYEQVKYADNVGVSSIDEQIVGTLMKTEKLLQADKPNNGDIEDSFEQLGSLFTRRTKELSDSKRGGF